MTVEHQPELIIEPETEPETETETESETETTKNSETVKPTEEETTKSLKDRITTITTVKKIKGAGNYSVVVYVKDGNKIIKKTVKKFCIYSKLKAKSLTTSKASKKAKVGNKIKLTAKATGGGGRYQYKFACKYKKFH